MSTAGTYFEGLPGKTMRDFLDNSFVLDGAPFRIAAKVGIAVFPEDGSDADTLFQHAEAALKKDTRHSTGSNLFSKIYISSPPG